MNNKKTIMLSSIILGSLVLILGITYAVFTYQANTVNQQLILGDIYMHYEEVNAIGIEGALPGDDYSEYFEFKISGKNTYTKQDIYYDVILSQGDVAEGKTEEDRIPDEYLKFKLTKVNEDNSETILLEDQTYSDLTNQIIHVETIAKNTTNEINNTYRLYMVISERLVIGNGSDAAMTTEEFNKVFASIKVNVTGDFNKRVVAENFVSAVKSRYGTDETLVAVNTDGDLYDGVGEIREFRYSGPTANNYVFFDTNGNGTKEENEIWRIIGVFEDNGEEKVKLARNTTLTSREMPTSSYIIDGTTYSIHSGSNNAYWNNPDSLKSTNYTDWTKAGLQYYLNTERDESTATPNAGYLSLLTTEAKELISPTTYYLGNVDRNVSTVKLSYNQERDATRKWTDNQASWDGLVGLMYPSDYGYSASNVYWETDMLGWNSAESDGVVASSTSWLYKTVNHTGNNEWFLSPSSFDSRYAMSWYFTGIVDVDIARNSYYSGARPVLNLKSEAKVIDGEGTSEEPFVVVIE